MELNQFPERFKSKVEVHSDNCWEWFGGYRSNGYGDYYSDGKSHIAHRWAKLFSLGIDSSPLEASHLCGNRYCVNPEHIVLESGKENISRINGKEYCRTGRHLMTLDNIYHSSKGPTCHQCKKDSANKYARRTRG
jgi:hypothetical protein